MYLVISLAVLVLVVAALVDIITRPEESVNHLPKVGWVILVVVLPLIGSIVWFAVGHEYSTPVDRGTFGDPRRRGEQSRSSDADNALGSTEEQLARLDREIEFHEKQARIAELQAKLDARRKDAE